MRLAILKKIGDPVAVSYAVLILPGSIKNLLRVIYYKVELVWDSILQEVIDLIRSISRRFEECNLGALIPY